MSTSASATAATAGRAAEFNDLLAAVTPLLSRFIAQADSPAFRGLSTNGTGVCDPQRVLEILKFHLPDEGRGKAGLLETLDGILQCSVNTWGQGFMSKLYSEPTPTGVLSELILATLNTGVHVYKASPALTVIEKTVAKALAGLFGLTGPYAGGTTQAGGSASNLTALVVARNTLFPDTKLNGCASKRLVLFTSADGHYSLEKAAQVCGMGSSAVWSVPVDHQGSMIVSELEKEVKRAKTQGYAPFFVNATAGTTVLGSYDSLKDIGAVCAREGLWFHVDASWGGSVIFSRAQRHKLVGSHLADSITVNPHKMLNVPIICSFLLAKDTRQFWKSNTLPASYLFHGPDAEAPKSNGNHTIGPTFDEEIWDLADMTLQCGRRGDALKMALAWIFHGTAGFERRIDGAFEVSGYLAQLVADHAQLVLLSPNPPPCLQVCFMYRTSRDTAEENTRITREIAKQLLNKDFHIDFASGPHGSFLRAVVNLQTERSTVEALVSLVVKFGSKLAPAPAQNGMRALSPG